MSGKITTLANHLFLLIHETNPFFLSKVCTFAIILTKAEKIYFHKRTQVVRLNSDVKQKVQRDASAFEEHGLGVPTS